MAWITVSEYAAIKSVSERTVRRWIDRDEIESKEIPHPRRKDLVSYLVNVSIDNADTNNADIADIDNADTNNADTNNADIADIDNADTNNADIADIDATEIELFDNIEELPAIEESLKTDIVPAQGEPLPDLRPRAREIPLQYEELVSARVQIVAMVEEMGSVSAFYTPFKMGLICERAAEVIGSIPSERTIYRWVTDFKRGGAIELCPRYDAQMRGRKVPEAVRNMLLKILLNPNKIAVATAVTYVRDHYRVKNMKLDCSYRTMLRWVNEWKDEHIEEWTIAREGVKYYREKINRTVLRDWTMVAVGDVWVSDGHTLELMIIDPRDGKAKKHELVVWFDAGSRMPMGGALNVTENTEVIQLSFRNAAMFAGYLPQIVYTDNGKAYKSRYMLGKTADAIESELQGMFARLGITTIHSIAYNAKAKIIERWWQDVQNQVERMLPAFTGPHNQAKPANLHRNEKFVQKRFPHEAITIEKFKAIFEYWAIEIYGRKPHPDYPDKTRMEVFQEGSAEIPAERRITPEQLNFMLLAIERKRVSNQGITLNKAIYWAEEMIRYVGRDVTVRWDFWDVRSILVYDEADQFICQAPMRQLRDPLVKMRDDGALSRRELAAELAGISRTEKRAKESTDEILSLLSNATTDLTHLLSAEEIGIINDTPLMPALPGREETLDDKIAALKPEPVDEDEHQISAETREQLRSIGLDV